MEPVPSWQSPAMIHAILNLLKNSDCPLIALWIPKMRMKHCGQQVLNGKACWTEDGVYINSASDEKGISINGLKKEKGLQTIIAWLEKQGIGHATVNYKLRDWLFSRQRYWGEPFPVIHWDDGEIEVLRDEDLPVMLPEMKKYEPGADGESPLANATDWLFVTKNGRKGRRETNTMPQWAGSCWYYLRFIDPDNDKAPFSQRKRTVLDACRSLYRRGRTCRPSSIVQPFLAQGTL